MDLSRVDITVSNLIAAGISPATASSYAAGLRRFLSFCQQSVLQPFPLTEQTMCRFAAHLFDQALAPGTIRLYLSAVRFVQISEGGGDPALASFPRLHYVMRGITREHRASSRPQRLPITPEVLHALFQVWSTATPHYDYTMLWAACTLGFFGFLRAGEFTSTPRGGNPPISLADVSVDSRETPTQLAIVLRFSKTDPSGNGCTIHIGRSGSNVCPVAAMLAYLAVRPSTPGPLLVHRDGTPLTRTYLVSAVRTALSQAGYNTAQYTGHSFRIGAATAAARAGLPDSLIQTLGRWRSPAFLRYIRTPVQTLLGVSRTIMGSNVSAPQTPPQS